jgi:hypothetical protein
MKRQTSERRRRTVGPDGLLSLILVFAPWSCGAGSIGEDRPSREGQGERELDWSFQSASSSQLDVLFVVDDSAAIAGFLPALTVSYPQMADLLQAIPTPQSQLGPAPNSPPSLHVGFVPASFGAAAGECPTSEVRAAACALPPRDQFLATSACGTQPNFGGSLESEFSCMSSFGIEGCDRPQPFAAIRRALGGDPRGGALDGRTSFLRDSAALQIVIVSAQDDASGSTGGLEDVASFADFLKALRPDPNRLMVSVIGPPSDCSLNPPPASAVPRLSALVGAFGGHGAYVGLCSGSLAQVLSSLTTRLAYLLGPPCLQGLRDNDLELAGVQANCAVQDRTEQLDGSIAHAALPSCDRAGPPCWRVSADPVRCPVGLAFQIDRGGGWCPQLSTFIEVSCVGCLDASDPACGAPR